MRRVKDLAGYAVQLTRDEGLGTMLVRGAGFVRRRFFGKRARYLPTKKVLQAQRAECAAAPGGLPSISILTPLYNTPEKYLREFLDSFVNQTAPNGQLVLADASDPDHAEVGAIVREYQAKNQRIVYKKIENQGIAANTNAAAALAEGDYLALADHDDILAPHAMYTMGKAILQLRQQGLADDFLYSDEALFEKSIRRPRAAHFKPDYAPDYLLCCNYICHLAVFRRSLYQELGGERPECDGSQDHDLFLRLAQRTGGAAHVPQVLYYWRVHAGSTSGGAEAKPYVANGAKKALADHLARTGGRGTVEDGLYPSTYRVKWEIQGSPKVSILIPNKDHTAELEQCLHSLWTKTQWEHFQVIVIENNSTDPETRALLEKLLKMVRDKGRQRTFAYIRALAALIPDHFQQLFQQRAGLRVKDIMILAALVILPGSGIGIPVSQVDLTSGHPVTDHLADIPQGDLHPHHALLGIAVIDPIFQVMLIAPLMMQPSRGIPPGLPFCFIGAVVPLVIDAAGDKLRRAVLAQVMCQTLCIQPTFKAVPHHQHLMPGNGLEMPLNVHYSASLFWLAGGGNTSTRPCFRPRRSSLSEKSSRSWVRFGL